jgi:hypothetical protein
MPGADSQGRQTAKEAWSGLRERTWLGWRRRRKASSDFSFYHFSFAVISCREQKERQNRGLD